MEKEKLKGWLEDAGPIILAIAVVVGAVAELYHKLSEAVGQPQDWRWPWSQVVLGIVALSALSALGLMLARRRQSRSSSLSSVDLFRLDPTKPELLVGREDDLARLKNRVTADPLVFLVGESGCGKSALLRAGVEKNTIFTESFLPIYIDLSALDWEEGPLRALRAGFRRLLPAEGDIRKRLEKSSEPDALQEAFEDYHRISVRPPLLLLDQFDDYQAQPRHRERFLKDQVWRNADDITKENAFWRVLKLCLEHHLLSAIVACRKDAADGLESIRLVKSPPFLRLRRLGRGAGAEIINRLEKARPEVFSEPPRGWQELRDRLVDDTEGNPVGFLPQQLKVALLGLRELRPPTLRAYERNGGLQGLEALYIESAINEAAGLAGVGPRDVLRLLVELVDRPSEPDRTEPRKPAELAAAAGIPEVAAETALERLQEAEIVRRPDDPSAIELEAQLDHGYLARPLLRLERDLDRWRVLLRDGARSYAEAGSNIMRRWRAFLPLVDQARLFWARVRGRFRYGEYRAYAVKSLARAIPIIAVAAVIGLLGWQAIEEQRIASAVGMAWQLTAEAPLKMSESEDLQDESVLLAVESLRRAPQFEGGASLSFASTQALRSALSLLAKPIARFIHEGQVAAVAFSPDGQYLVTGSDDKMVRVFDIAANREVARTAQDGPVSAVAITAHQVATASGKQVEVFDINSKTVVARAAHGGPVKTVVFSRDGKYLASGDDKTVQVLDMGASQVLSSVEVDEPVKELSFSATGQRLAVVTGMTLRIIDVLNGKDIVPAINQSWDVAFSGNGKLVAIETDDVDHSTRVLELEGGTEVFDRIRKSGRALSVALGQDGHFLVLGQRDGGWLLYQIHNGNADQVFNGNARSDQFRTAQSGLHKVQLLGPAGRWVAFTFRDRTTRIVDVATMHASAILLHQSPIFAPSGEKAATYDGKDVRVFDLNAGPTMIMAQNEISAAAFSADGQYLAVWDKFKDKLEIFKTSSGHRVSGPIDAKGGIVSVTFSSNGRYVAIGTFTEPTRIIEVSSGREITSLGNYMFVHAAAFSADGRFVAIGRLGAKDTDPGAWIFDSTSWQEVKRISSEEVCALAFSFDGHFLAVGKGDTASCELGATGLLEGMAWRQPSQTRVYAVETNHEATPPINHSGGVVALAFSPNGRYLLSGSTDDIAQMFDLQQAREIWSLQHHGWVNAVTFSPDGRLAATADEYGTVRVLDALSGRELSLDLKGQPILALAFSSDSHRLLTATHSGVQRGAMITSTLLSADDLMKQACAAVSKNLTKEQWEKGLAGEPYRPTCPGLPSALDKSEADSP